MRETTTGDAIAYLPSGFTDARGYLRGLADKKKLWGIQILDMSPTSTHVKFEDALTFKVRKRHTNHFFSNVLGIAPVVTPNATVTLEGLVNEAKGGDGSVIQLISELRATLMSLRFSEPYSLVVGDVKSWWAYFPKSNLVKVDSALVDLNHVTDSVDKVMGDVRAKYDDRGYLEMVLSSLDSGTSLAVYPVFSEKENLLGARMVTTYNGVVLQFEAYCSVEGVPSERLVIDDEDVLELLSNDKNVMIVKHTIYPKGKIFGYNFIRKLKTLVKERD